MKQAKQFPKEVSLELVKFTANGPKKWQEIVAHLNTKFVVKNWLTEVRSPLQGLLNARVLVRANDVHNEIYRQA